MKLKEASDLLQAGATMLEAERRRLRLACRTTSFLFARGKSFACSYLQQTWAYNV
jgi:hypothetical protein